MPMSKTYNHLLTSFQDMLNFGSIKLIIVFMVFIIAFLPKELTE